MVVLSCIRTLQSPLRLAAIWGIGSVLFFVLMYGGVFALTPVATDKWGGLVLTLFVFICTVVISIPGGIAIALALQSKLPVIRYVSFFAIDVVRSIPLISVVFAVAFFAPFVLPGSLTGDKIYRVIIGYAGFFACLQAVVISGGMQSIPSGQHEAASALGMRRWQVLALVILPQAKKYFAIYDQSCRDVIQRYIGARNRRVIRADVLGQYRLSDWRMERFLHRGSRLCRGDLLRIRLFPVAVWCPHRTDCADQLRSSRQRLSRSRPAHGCSCG
jgi:ABC-type amino acid transport system permease subunit